MTTIYLTATSLQRLDANGEFDEAQLAAAVFLARYSGRTLDAYRHDPPIRCSEPAIGGSGRCALMRCVGLSNTGV